MHPPASPCRVRRAPPRSSTDRRCRAQCGLFNSFNGHHPPLDQLHFLPPDRPHDQVFNDRPTIISACMDTLGSTTPCPRAHTHTFGSCWRTQFTHASRSGSCIALRARRTHTQRTHAEQHMTPARTAHALGAHTHELAARARSTRTASSPPPPAATTSRWVYC